jgi:hypothetical protein
VITPVAGREAHLRLQQQALRRSELAAQLRVIVSMGAQPADALDADDVLVHVTGGDHLPLARARNRGAEVALRAGADLLVFLDVDCLPAPQLVGRYVDAARRAPGDLLCGPVHYLDPPDGEGYDLDRLPATPIGHPARPTPRGSQLVRGGEHTLFWSLSFAVTPAVWAQVGGFDERYEGYGGEDTDFGQRARAAGIGLCWVGDAWSFHQHHPVSDPPVEHVGDVVRNANLFHDTWGWWPMTGWLARFHRLGLITWDPGAASWALPD